MGGWVYVRGVRRGFGGTLEVGGYVGGGGGGFDLRSCSKKSCFWALSVKLQHIGRPWMNVFVRVCRNLKKIRVIV